MATRTSICRHGGGVGGRADHETARRRRARSRRSVGRPATAIKTTDLAARRAAADADADAYATADTKTTFDDRTVDQVRADLFIDLLLTGAPAIDATIDISPGGLGAIRAQVQITLPITTLTGVTDGGAEVDGKAPIDPDTARKLAGGPTSICNLCCFCVRHHTMKTETEWTARQLPGGRIEWASPSQRLYIDDPPRVIFSPRLDRAPF